MTSRDFRSGGLGERMPIRAILFDKDGTLKDDIAGVSAKDAGESYRDARIKAFYIMASGPGQGFVAESLKLIGVPFVVS